MKNLELKWILPNQVFGAWQSTPLVVDGVMYVTQRPNDVLALDAKTGRVFWLYRHTPSPDARVCCGSNNRGVAILGDTRVPRDARRTADRDRREEPGRPLWNVAVGDPKLGYSITMAPLVVKDKVLVGMGGGEYGIRGYVAAYDARTGKEVWRFHTVPAPGEPGSETWSGDTWKTGGGSIWLTPSYDPELNLTYWGVGNPGPDWNPDQRPGDNLYTDSVIAVDADTGALRWHYQFTPNDAYDYDAVQIAVLADITWRGHADQGDAVGEPQRQLLRARSRRTASSCRGNAVRESELDERIRRERAARSRRRSRRGSRPGPATRAAPTGTRRHSARARSCST